MSTTIVAQRPADWYYQQGAPRYVAEAFGDYYADHTPGARYSAAITRFNGDPLGSAYLHWHGHCRGKHLSEMCDSCRTFAQFGEMPV